MRITQIAAWLGLDQADAIVAVPLEDRPFVRNSTAATKPKRRIARVV